MSKLENTETEQGTLLTEETGTQSTPDTSSSTTEETSSSQGTGNTSNPQSEMMATAATNLNIPPLAHFEPKTDDWNHWTSHYELFEAATQRDGLSGKVHIDTLIYLMGHNAANVYQSFKLSTDDNMFANVEQKFLVFERTQFV